MPVMGQHDVIEALAEAIDPRHHRMAGGHRQRAAGTEIVLYVDDQQHIVMAKPDLHFAPALELIFKLSNSRASHRSLRSLGAQNARPFYKLHQSFRNQLWICHLRITLIKE